MTIILSLEVHSAALYVMYEAGVHLRWVSRKINFLPIIHLAVQCYETVREIFIHRTLKGVWSIICRYFESKCQSIYIECKVEWGDYGV